MRELIVSWLGQHFQKQSNQRHDEKKPDVVAVTVSGAGVVSVNATDVLNSDRAAKQLEALEKLKESHQLRTS